MVGEINGGVRVWKSAYSIWVYEKKDYADLLLGDAPVFAVFFAGDKVKRIGCFDANGCQSIQGLYLNASNGQVIERFDHPSYVSISDDDLTRTVSYDKYNVFFALAANKVVALGVYDSSQGPVRYIKEKKSGE